MIAAPTAQPEQMLRNLVRPQRRFAGTEPRLGEGVVQRAPASSAGRISVGSQSELRRHVSALSPSLRRPRNPRRSRLTSSIGRPGHRIKYVKVDADTGDEVPNEDIVKGSELDKRQYIEFTKEELGKLALKWTRTIEIDEFIDRSDIAPRYLSDSTTFLRHFSRISLTTCRRSPSHSGAGHRAHFDIRDQADRSRRPA